MYSFIMSIPQTVMYIIFAHLSFNFVYTWKLVIIIIIEVVKKITKLLNYPICIVSYYYGNSAILKVNSNCMYAN